MSEKSLVRYGNLEITAGFAGKLYIDNVYKKDVKASTLLTISNLAEGEHSVRIEGEENLERTVSVLPGMNASVTLDKTMKSIAGMPEMVFVQGGTFQMGSNDGESDEKPIHRVTVNDFYIGKYEVTQKQWRDVMGSNPSVNNECDACPVENITWYGIQKFIQILNAKTRNQFRLPTEAEWEFSAKGGNQSRNYLYSGSNMLDDVGWWRGNAKAKTHPVGQKMPNELGIYDMTGNVMEFCSDIYNEEYYSVSPTENPIGVSTGEFRAVRGGAWSHGEDKCRSYSRRGYPATVHYNSLGFRLCMTK
jgi:formylglycine-generating enzyme required for sulfatase activity